jgi:hypothetical protein
MILLALGPRQIGQIVERHPEICCMGVKKVKSKKRKVKKRGGRLMIHHPRARLAIIFMIGAVKPGTHVPD